MLLHHQSSSCVIYPFFFFFFLKTFLSFFILPFILYPLWFSHFFFDVLLPIPFMYSSVLRALSAR